jgi:hypothetical protein
MIGASALVILQLLAQSDLPADPNMLVERLGSSRYAQREAAAKALEELAGTALPALRQGRGSRDPEIRTRSIALLRQIEGSLLTQPTMVWLNFEDALLRDVVRSLSQRTGMKIGLFPENLPKWKAERITLRDSEPLPFWKAIDRLCAGASLQNDLELRGISNSASPTLALSDRMTRPHHPVSDHGPFRVSLVGLEFQRHVGFAILPPRPRGNRAGREPVRAHEPAFPQPLPVTSEQCSIQFQITAEPRLGANQDGPLQILEARDDNGNSLVAAAHGNSLTQQGGYLGGTCSSVVHVRAPLIRPDHPGRTIKALRGFVPLRVTSREPDPLVVPLAGAVGKSFDKGDLHVAVHEVRFDPNTQQRQIQLSLRESHADGLAPADERGVQDGGRPDQYQQNLELLDAHGQALPWYQTTIDVEASRITVTMADRAGAEPSELRYYGMTETTMNVPFAFTDIPMP